MSKKYFAEYIPVEGEIKEHSMVFADGKLGTVVYASKYGIGYEVEFPDERNVFPFTPEYIKPAKLCLCSRDIQIGDKVIGSHKIEGVYFGKSQSGDFIINWEDGNTVCGLHDPDAFKVIGKISPDAIWVTRGMEFDEDDVCIMATDKHFDISNPIEVVKKEDIGEIWVEIKCPTCKTFH